MSTPTSANGNLPARLSPGRKYEILDPEVNGVFAAHGFPLDIVERKQVIRAFILDAQDAIALLPQCEPPVIHHFAPGVYMREIRMPRGSLIIGKIHRHAHFNLIPSGDLSVLTESGPRRRQLDVWLPADGVRRRRRCRRTQLGDDQWRRRRREHVCCRGDWWRRGRSRWHPHGGNQRNRWPRRDGNGRGVDDGKR